MLHSNELMLNEQLQYENDALLKTATGITGNYYKPN